MSYVADYQVRLAARRLTVKSALDELAMAVEIEADASARLDDLVAQVRAKRHDTQLVDDVIDAHHARKQATAMVAAALAEARGRAHRDSGAQTCPPLNAARQAIAAVMIATDNA